MPAAAFITLQPLLLKALLATPSLLLVLDRTDFQDLLAEVPGLRKVFEGAARARRAALVDVSASLAAPVPL